MHRLTFLVMFAVCVGSASGQEAIPPAYLAALPEPESMSGPSWTMDFILGTGTGLRFSHELSEGGPSLEMFAGLQYVLLPSVGVGLRKHTSAISTKRYSFAVNPGVDLYGAFVWFDIWGGRPQSPLAGIATVDVDFVNRLAIGDKACGQFGFKLGCGSAFAKRMAILPVVGVYLGMSY